MLSLAVPIILFFLLRLVLPNCCGHTLKVQAGITFYLHSFLLILFLSALSAAIGTTFDLKPDSRFMEYVWKGAYGVSSTRIVRINTSNQSALMNEASILGLDVHQATI